MAVALRPLLLEEARRVVPTPTPGFPPSRSPPPRDDLESIPAQGSQIGVARSSFLGPPTAPKSSLAWVILEVGAFLGTKPLAFMLPLPWHHLP